jgi:hypothetical protein
MELASLAFVERAENAGFLGHRAWANLTSRSRWVISPPKGRQDRFFSAADLVLSSTPRSGVNHVARTDAIAVGRHGENPGRGDLYRLKSRVADDRRIVTRRNIVNVVDSEFAHFASVRLDAEATLENNTQVMDLARVGVSDWPYITRPPPAGLQ